MKIKLSSVSTFVISFIRKRKSERLVEQFLTLNATVYVPTKSDVEPGT